MGRESGKPSIEAVNISMGMVIDANGCCGVITHFFDADGEECAARDAVSCVAECDGRLFVIDLRECEPISTN